MTQLSEHFTLEEFVFSSTAIRKGIDNTPTPAIVEALTTAANGLESVRNGPLGGKPCHVDSAYRCWLLNAAVGGAAGSAHMEGWAIDFICPDFGTPLEIAKAIIASGIAFDKLIMEGTWVHISFAPTLRRIVLTAHFGAGGTTYTEGLST